MGLTPGSVQPKCQMIQCLINMTEDRRDKRVDYVEITTYIELIFEEKHMLNIHRNHLCCNINLNSKINGLKTFSQSQNKGHMCKYNKVLH